jgi:branched-chain amino acid transport system ATP-binding protein
MTTLLHVDAISVRYKQLVALRKLSMKVEEGETVFVTGPNGAGKSTLLRAIAGVVTPREGLIEFRGTQIGGKTPEDIARMGFSMVPEGREVFGGLTIEENLRLGTGMRADKDQAARDLEQVYAVFPMLKDRRDQAAGVLSGGQQQMLVIGRALMASPKLIAIDEPSLGLAPKVTDDVYATLLKLRDTRGLTLLIVEQSATRAMLTGGRMILLRSGEVALEGDARELVKGEALKKAYFGYGDH